MKRILLLASLLGCFFLVWIQPARAEPSAGPIVNSVYIDIMDASPMSWYVADAGIVPSDTQQAAVKKINAWICRNMTYDPAYQQVATSSALADRRGVCWQYAEIFARMCQSCGIECGVVYGYSRDGTGHAWDYTVINRMRLYTDTTWNQSGGIHWLMISRKRCELDHKFNY